MYRVETYFKSLFLIINNHVINFINVERIRVRVLLLRILNNFDNFFIDIRETNILRIKDYDLIEILIYIIYYINNIKLKSIDLIEILRLFLRIFSFKDDIKETFKTLLQRLN